MSVSQIVFDAQPKTPISEFLPELTYEFAEAPEDMFPHFILKAANRIARDGNVLTRTSVITTAYGVESYLLESIDCMDFVALLRVIKIQNAARDIIRVISAPACVHMFQETHAWFEAPNIIHISPCKPPDVFHAIFSVAPTYDACELDRVFLTDYYDLLLDGVKYFLYNMTGKPWSNVQRAQECYMRFLDGIKRASIEARMNGQRGMIKRQHSRIF